MGLAQRNLQILVLGVASLYFLVVGSYKATHFSADFVAPYTGARCFLKGCNPYDIHQLERQYFQAGGLASQLPPWRNEPPVYPPSTFLVLAPLALTSVHTSRICWALLNSCLFIAAVVFMLAESPKAFRWLATILGALFLGSSWGMVALGQASTFAISLAVIGTALFLRNRYPGLAAVMLMLSLAVKPQIGALIFLYLLVRRIHWRYLVAAGAGAVLILVLAGAILKARPASANWQSDLAANVAASVQPGSINDPSPADKAAIGFFSNLQVITSVYSAVPRIYNTAAYAVFLVFFATWMIAVRRIRTEAIGDYLPIASLAVLSLMPVYHRSFDTRLLLIGIPAVVLIFQADRVVGALILAVTILEIEHSYTQYWVRLLFEHHRQWRGLLENRLLYVVLMQQPAVELCLLAGLYLVAMFRIAPTERGEMKSPSGARRAEMAIG